MAKKFTRKIFTSMIVGTSGLLFISITALIIILAQGKKITDDGKIIDTSIIRINSIPSDVNVYVNDKISQKNDNRVEGIVPGEVKVKLTKAGYGSWEKTINVKPGIITDIYAQLFPENLKSDVLVQANPEQMYFSNNPDYIFYIVVNDTEAVKNGIWKMKLTKNLLDFGEIKPTQLATFDATLLNTLKNNPYKLTISEDNNKVLLIIDSQKAAYIYDANTLNKVINLTETLGFYASDIQWFRNSDSLVIKKDNILLEYEIGLNQSNLIKYGIQGEDLIYAVNSNVVYYYRADTDKVYKYINKNSSALDMPKNLKLFPNLKSLHTSKTLSNVLIIEFSQALVYIDFEKQFTDLVDVNGSITKIAPNARSFIYKKGEDLYSYYLDETLDGSSYFGKRSKLPLTTATTAATFFSPSSKNIVAVIKNQQNEKELWLMDFDGQNSTKLFDGKNLASDTLQISQSGVDLYALIQSTEDSAKGNNIYKFSLEVK